MTAVSKEAMSYYDQANAIWNRLGKDAKLPPARTMALAKEIYREFMGESWGGQWKLTSGNRFTWSRYGTTFAVNPDHRGRGFKEVVHGISHWIHMKKRPKDRPHNAEHAALELRMTRWAEARINGQLT